MLRHLHEVKKPLTREEIGKRMDELARKYAENHDQKIREELEKLSWRYGTDAQVAFSHVAEIEELNGRFGGIEKIAT
jgi:hypothetical protein